MKQDGDEDEEEEYEEQEQERGKEEELNKIILKMKNNLKIMLRMHLKF